MKRGRDCGGQLLLSSDKLYEDVMHCVGCFLLVSQQAPAAPVRYGAQAAIQFFYVDGHRSPSSCPPPPTAVGVTTLSGMPFGATSEPSRQRSIIQSSYALPVGPNSPPSVDGIVELSTPWSCQ